MIVLTYVMLAQSRLARAPLSSGRSYARPSDRGRYVLAAAAALFVLGIGGALYLQFGHPFLATRTLEGDKATRSQRADRASGDGRAQPSEAIRAAGRYSGRAYLTAGDPGDAAKAFCARHRSVAGSRARLRHFSIPPMAKR